MDSIENLFSYMTPARLMIKIWEYSHHVLHVSPDECLDCKCQEYLNMCIDAARNTWNAENYIYFDTALYRFQFRRKKYVILMSLKNEDNKKQLVAGILRGER